MSERKIPTAVIPSKGQMPFDVLLKGTQADNKLQELIYLLNKRIPGLGDKWIEQFLKLNESFFLSLDIIKPIGGGSYGTAYELENNRILKIFRNRNGLRYYQDMDKENSPNNVKIYGYGSLKNPKGFNTEPFYWAIIEKVKTLNYDAGGQEKDFVTLLTFLKDSVIEYWIDNFDREDLAPLSDRDAANIATHIVDQLYGDVYLRFSHQPLLIKFMEENIDKHTKYLENIAKVMLQQFKIGRRDIKPDNFGFRLSEDSPPEIAYFDAQADSPKKPQSKYKKVEASKQNPLLKSNIFCEASKGQKNPTQWLKEFDKLNEHLLTKLRPQEFLDEGNDGEAYLLSEDKVLKIFKGLTLYSFYRKRMTHPNPSLCKIYDVGIFHLPKDTDPEGAFYGLGYAIMERVETLPHTDDQELETLLDELTWAVVKMDIEQGFDWEPEEAAEVYSSEILKKNKKLLLGITDCIRNQEISQAKILSILKAAIFEARESEDHMTLDVASKNMGFRGDEAVYFDPFGSYEEHELPEFERYKDLIYKSAQRAKKLYKIFGDDAPNEKTFELLADNYHLHYRFSASAGYEKADKLFKQWLDELIDINWELFYTAKLSKKLGHGSFGEAYETEDGRVFKLFFKSEFLETYRKMKAEGDTVNPTIYGFGILKMPEIISVNFGLYWVLMEKLDVLSVPKDEDGDPIRNSKEYILKEILDDIFIFTNSAFYKGSLTVKKGFLADKIQQIKENKLSPSRFAKELLDYIDSHRDVVFKNSRPEYVEYFFKPKHHLFISNFLWSMILNHVKEREDLHSENFGKRYNEEIPMFFDADSSGSYSETLPTDSSILKTDSTLNHQDHD